MSKPNVSSSCAAFVAGGVGGALAATICGFPFGDAREFRGGGAAATSCDEGVAATCIR